MRNYLHFFDICCFSLLIIAFSLAMSGQVVVIPLATVALAITIAICLILLRRKNTSGSTFSRQLKNNRLFAVVIVVITIIALLARFIPLFFKWDYTLQNDLGDASVHYYAAQQLSHGWLDNNILEYEQLYPYLYPYSYVLSVFYKIFSNATLVILCSNVIFDIIGATFIYLFTRNITSKRAATISAFLYLINPFSIIMCWMPLSIELVNTLLCITLYLLQMLLKYIQKHKVLISYILATITGVLICIGNSFRPIFSVFIVVFILCCLVPLTEILRNSKLCKSNYTHRIKATLVFIAAPMLILFVSFSLASKTANHVLASSLGNDSLQIRGGWSFYVGSNYETNGTWSQPDSQHFFLDVIPASTSTADAQTAIMAEGITRYRQLNPLQLINHFANKLNVLFGDSGNSIHDIKYVFGFSEDSWKYKLLQSIVSLFYAILLITSTFFTWNSVKNRTRSSNLSITILQLTLLGLTSSILIVEVMNRYSSVFYPMLAVMSALFIYGKLSSNTNRQANSMAPAISHNKT